MNDSNGEKETNEIERKITWILGDQKIKLNLFLCIWGWIVADYWLSMA